MFKLLYDFFRLWIYYGHRKEAWEDAKFINDKKIQKELEEQGYEIEKMLGKLNKEGE